jgi:indolepyruvate ferredoxin oxidoreductase
VFANIGDGTYAHSGSLAIRQAIAANVPITYKILYNGFVSMTGGQPIEGGMTPVQILAELAAEGVRKMALVVDDPQRYAGVPLPVGVSLRHRDAMDETQREFREFKGVSIILYDQPCATERRRLRKRGKWADPALRAFINSEVCEGCGDCGRVSNCMAIEPLETEFGRKRRINQSSCNKDFSCVEGFCPSFVTVHGGRLRKPQTTSVTRYLPPIPEPTLPEIGERFSVLVAGIGGSGVVTVSQTLAVAAYLDGLYSSNLDLTGLSQKYGAVTSHVRMAREPGALHATRIAAGEADALIGCDLIVAAGDECVSKLRPGKTRAVISADLTPTADFARNPNWSVDGDELIGRLRGALGDDALVLDAQRLAAALLGDAIASNMFMFGAAWQKGLVPIRREAIDRAIELNGVAIEANKLAFEWGRRAAHDASSVETLVGFDEPTVERPSLDALIKRRVAHLTEYRNAAYAARYSTLIERVRAAETKAGLGDSLTLAVARSYHKLLAAKDEWEVARLFAAPEFERALNREFEGPYRLHFHIGAWPFARSDPTTGLMTKGEVGPWAITAFRVLARLKFLRGTWLDPFRLSEERKLERRLLAEFEADLEDFLVCLTPATHSIAVRVAGAYESIRGYGRVKEASAADAARARADALRELKAAEAPAAKAA